ncbi:hypothetical protein OS189_17885 [Sulfitobacter sp. F26169L]|nr:hypothetical protein [Sulfitobacter sp. F26169L]
MASGALAQDGCQRMTGTTANKEELPQLCDRHPLVAAAGRYIDALYTDPGEMFVVSKPKPMSGIVGLLAKLGDNRRHAAGGFLYGVDDSLEGPFEKLRQDPCLQGGGAILRNGCLIYSAPPEREPHFSLGAIVLFPRA